MPPRFVVEVYRKPTGVLDLGGIGLDSIRVGGMCGPVTQIALH
jgi:hypothetical protein